jgi:Dual-action HEIGH metallo-peptidase
MRHDQHPTFGATFSTLGAAALAATVLIGCEGEGSSPDADQDAADASGESSSAAADQGDADAELAEIVENLKEAGYPEREIAVDDDGVVMVGGDAVVTLGASREMVGLTRRGDEAQDDDASFRQYRTTNVISTAIDIICVNGAAFAGDAVLSAGLDAAIARYNAQNLSFDMTRTSGPAGGCDVVINGVLAGGSGGSAGFPVGGLPYQTINIGSGVAGYGVAVAGHVIEHELGHCIGFRHSDFYNRAISCGSGGDEGGAGIGAVHIPNTPTDAVFDGSVMNSCFNGGSTGVFTAEDLDALHQLYGRDCCAGGSGAGCGNVPVNECVGATDPYCNDVAWDGICVGEVTSLGCGACPAAVEHSCCTTGGAGCENNVIEQGVCATDSYCCDVAWDGLCVGEVASLGFGLCGSSCCGPHGGGGCDNGGVQACVCAADSYCCNVAWDGLCVAEVESLGCSQCG